MRFSLWSVALYALGILSFLSQCATAVDRHYYIAAVNINWDYTTKGAQRYLITVNFYFNIVTFLIKILFSYFIELHLKLLSDKIVLVNMYFRSSTKFTVCEK